MKNLKLGLPAVILALAAFTSCKKVVKDPPVPDKETKTAVDIAYATHLVSDVEMICSVMGEDDTEGRNKFYDPDDCNTTAVTGTVTVVRNLETRRISFNFNQTKCRDGRLRDGTVYLFYKYRLPSQVSGDSVKPGAQPPIDQFDYIYPDLPYPYTGNENYIRDYNFGGRITLEEYKVDGWHIDNKDMENPNPATNDVFAYITNLRPNNNTPVAGDLKWNFKGSFTMKKNLDSMAWKGSWTKTLDNTEDPNVFKANAQTPITWSLATISYYGEAKGRTPGNVPFNITYHEKSPIVRTFTCAPEVVGSISLSPTYTLMGCKSEYHPFIGGMATFTTGDAYPRELYYDNTETKYHDDKEPLALPKQCDNKAVIQIQGIYYPIDLKY